MTTDPIRAIKYDWKKAINEAILMAYRPDGVDMIDRTINGKPMDDEGEAYLSSPITAISGFLGLPNRKLKKHQSWKNVGLNFIGWQKDASLARLIFNFLLLVPINIICTPIKFAFNILKIFTEVIPATLAKITFVIGLGLRGDAEMNLRELHRDKHRTLGSKFLPGFGNVLLYGLGVLVTALSYGFSLAWTVGCWFLSPVNSVRDGYKIGYKAAGVFGGFVLAALNIAGIIAAWSIALPLLIQAAVPLVPVIFSHLPKPLFDLVLSATTHILPVISAIGSVLTPIAAALAKVVNVCTFGFVNASAIVASMPPVVGMGALMGPFIALIAAPIDKLVRFLKDKWHGIKPVVPTQIVYIEDGKVVDKPSSHSLVINNLRNQKKQVADKSIVLEPIAENKDKGVARLQKVDSQNDVVIVDKPRFASPRR